MYHILTHPSDGAAWSIVVTCAKKVPSTSELVELVGVRYAHCGQVTTVPSDAAVRVLCFWGGLDRRA